MLFFMIGLAAIAAFGMFLTWIILKIVSLAIRKNHVNKITAEISRSYYGINIAARIIAVCCLFLVGIVFIIGIIFDPYATAEEIASIVTVGIIFLIFALFRLIFLFRFIWKYRLNKNDYMIPVQMQLFMEHLQKQESNIIKPQEIEQKFNRHLQEQELLYKVEPDISDIQAIEQELKTEKDNNKSNTSLLDSSLTADSLINKPQTSNIFK